LENHITGDDMIGESGSVSTLVSSEKVYRDNLTGGSGRQVQDDESSRTPSFADSVSISPQAIALSRNVPPAGEASESGNGQDSERQPEAAEYKRQGNIDIKV
jgi:hypothetical protein